MNLDQALEQAQRLSREWELLGLEFAQKGEDLAQVLAEIQALLAIEKAKEE